MLEPILDAVSAEGTASLGVLDGELAAYCSFLKDSCPSELPPAEALAFWLNLYNAGSLRLASKAFREGTDSVLRVPGGFYETAIEIEGESLSLSDIEHGKIRRFKDPRAHSALMCGSVSCPTLGSRPYTGDALGTQLEDQMKSFLAAGAARYEGEALMLSRVFLWYGADFVRPQRMPTWLPTSRKRLVAALRPWLSEDLHQRVSESDPPIRFQSYDWSLRCAVA